MNVVDYFNELFQFPKLLTINFVSKLVVYLVFLYLALFVFDNKIATYFRFVLSVEGFNFNDFNTLSCVSEIKLTQVDRIDRFGKRYQVPLT